MTELSPAIIISLCSLGFSVYIFLRNSNKENASQITSIIVKLENIAEGITEIKADLRSVKDEIKELRERLAKCESSASQAHKRIDMIEKGEMR